MTQVGSASSSAAHQYQGATFNPAVSVKEVGTSAASATANSQRTVEAGRAPQPMMKSVFDRNVNLVQADGVALSPNDTIKSSFESRDGTPYLLVQTTPSECEVIKAESSDGRNYTLSPVATVEADTKGFAIQPDGKLLTHSGGNTINMYNADDSTQIVGSFRLPENAESVQHMSIDRENNLWITDKSGRIFHHDNTKNGWTAVPSGGNKFDPEPRCTADGKMAFLNKDGVWKEYTPSRHQWKPVDVSIQNSAFRDGMHSKGTKDVAMVGSKQFAVLKEGSVDVITDGETTHIDFPHNDPQQIVVDKRGRIWVMCKEGNVFFKNPKESEWKQLEHKGVEYTELHKTTGGKAAFKGVGDRWFTHPKAKSKMEEIPSDKLSEKLLQKSSDKRLASLHKTKKLTFENNHFFKAHASGRERKQETNVGKAALRFFFGKYMKPPKQEGYIAEQHGTKKLDARTVKKNAELDVRDVLKTNQKELKSQLKAENNGFLTQRHILQGADHAVDSINTLNKDSEATCRLLLKEYNLLNDDGTIKPQEGSAKRDATSKDDFATLWKNQLKLRYASFELEQNVVASDNSSDKVVNTLKALHDSGIHISKKDNASALVARLYANQKAICDIAQKGAEQQTKISSHIAAHPELSDSDKASLEQTRAELTDSTTREIMFKHNNSALVVGTDSVVQGVKGREKIAHSAAYWSKVFSSSDEIKTRGRFAHGLNTNQRSFREATKDIVYNLEPGSSITFDSTRTHTGGVLHPIEAIGKTFPVVGVGVCPEVTGKFAHGNGITVTKEKTGLRFSFASEKEVAGHGAVWGGASAGIKIPGTDVGVSGAAGVEVGYDKTVYNQKYTSDFFFPHDGATPSWKVLDQFLAGELTPKALEKLSTEKTSDNSSHTNSSTTAALTVVGNAGLGEIKYGAEGEKSVGFKLGLQGAAAVQVMSHDNTTHSKVDAKGEHSNTETVKKDHYFSQTKFSGGVRLPGVGTSSMTNPTDSIGVGSLGFKPNVGVAITIKTNRSEDVSYTFDEAKQKPTSATFTVGLDTVGPVKKYRMGELAKEISGGDKQVKKETTELLGKFLKHRDPISVEYGLSEVGKKKLEKYDPKIHPDMSKFFGALFHDEKNREVLSVSQNRSQSFESTLGVNAVVYDYSRKDTFSMKSPLGKVEFHHEKGVNIKPSCTGPLFESGDVKLAQTPKSEEAFRLVGKSVADSLSSYTPPDEKKIEQGLAQNQRYQTVQGDYKTLVAGYGEALREHTGAKEVDRFTRAATQAFQSRNGDEFARNIDAAVAALPESAKDIANLKHGLSTLYAQSQEIKSQLIAQEREAGKDRQNIEFVNGRAVVNGHAVPFKILDRAISRSSQADRIRQAITEQSNSTMNIAEIFTQPELMQINAAPMVEQNTDALPMRAGLSSKDTLAGIVSSFSSEELVPENLTTKQQYVLEDYFPKTSGGVDYERAQNALGILNNPEKYPAPAYTLASSLLAYSLVRQGVSATDAQRIESDFKKALTSQDLNGFDRTVRNTLASMPKTSDGELVTPDVEGLIAIMDDVIRT